VLLLAPLTLLATAAPPPAAAQCTLSSTGVAFGVYDVFEAAPLTATGSVTYFCGPPDRTVTIALDAGLSGAYRPRRMASGAERLAYDLYLDPAGVRIWGDGTAGTDLFTGSTGPPGAPGERTFTVPVYGRVPPGQDVGFGVYADTVTVTIIF
jgi:spore coat protein U-like protein